MAAFHSRPVSAQPRHRPKRPPAPPLPRGVALAEGVARYQDLLRRKHALGDEAAVAACYLEIGDLYLSCGETERAGEMYRRSLQVSRGLPRPSSLSV